MLGTHSFLLLMHQRKNGIQNQCQFRNTKLEYNNEDIKPNYNIKKLIIMDILT